MLDKVWAARCSYIRRLPPFAMCPDKIFQFASKVLVENFKGNVKFQVEEPNVATLGLENHSFKHWIASSPYFQPCDIISGQKNFTWLRTSRQAHDFIQLLQNKSLIQNEFKSFNMSTDIDLQREFIAGKGQKIKWEILFKEKT